MALPRGVMDCLQFVTVEFPDHTHLLFFPNLSLMESLIVRCIYRPTDNTDFTNNLCKVIADIHMRYSKDYTFRIRGDANLSDINWSDDSISGNNYPIPSLPSFHR